MNYSFTACNNENALSIWKLILNGLSKDVTIRSVKVKSPYTVNYMNSDAISFSTSTRNDRELEIIKFDDFRYAIDSLKKLDRFNTNTANECFKGSKIHKKRSPFFALLLWSGVIESIN